MSRFGQDNKINDAHLPVFYALINGMYRAISWYSFCVGQDIYRLFSIIEIILGNYQQV